MWALNRCVLHEQVGVICLFNQVVLNTFKTLLALWVSTFKARVIAGLWFTHEFVSNECMWMNVETR